MTKSHHGAYSEIAMYHYVEMAIVLQICGIVYEMYQSMMGSQKRDVKTVRSPSGCNQRCAENNHLKQLMNLLIRFKRALKTVNKHCVLGQSKLLI